MLRYNVVMENKNNYCVYKHISPVSKIYIGITNQNPPYKRWKDGKDYIHNSYFTNAIQKYGWKNFKHEILFENLSAEEASEKEIELINQFKSNEKRYGYNLADGGGGRIGIKHTEKTKKKMSNAAKGKPKSKEHRESLSISSKIRFKYPEQRKRLSILRVGSKANEETRKKLSELHTGYKFSDESKRKMSSSAIKSWTNERRKKAGKPIKQYDLKGNYINTFDSASEASRNLNINRNHINSCCNNKRKTAGGYIWKFLNSSEED